MNADLLEVVDGLGQPRVLVVGDLMLDRFVQGGTGRVSPEAPALVLRREGEAVQPGGAGRVAMLLQSLGARVSLAGAVGDDHDGRLLCGLLEQAGVDCRAVVVAADRPTTAKDRLCATASNGEPVQLLRLDRESTAPLPGPLARRLFEQVERPLEEFDAVLVADHGKGVCLPGLLADLLGTAATRGVPALVDPARGAPLGRYKGADALLPNRAEAGSLLGRELADVEDGLVAAEELLVAARADAILLKLDRDGLALAQVGQRVTLFPARARRVCDVTGAGDVVLAVAGLCRAARLDWETAAQLAMVAAAAAVERPCTQPLSRQELRLRLSRPDYSTAGKLVSLVELEALAAQWREWGLEVALTNGCFDLLHPGHVACLEEAAGLADVLVVAVNSDASVRRLKGGTRPVFPQQDRAALLAALGCVDHVLIFEEDTPHEVLRRLRPDVLAKGGDYKPDEVVGKEVVQGYGGRVCVTRRQCGYSSSLLMSEVLRRSAPAAGQGGKRVRPAAGPTPTAAPRKPGEERGLSCRNEQGRSRMSRPGTGRRLRSTHS